VCRCKTLLSTVHNTLIYLVIYINSPNGRKRANRSLPAPLIVIDQCRKNEIPYPEPLRANPFTLAITTPAQGRQMRLGLSPVGAAMSPASIHLPGAGLGHPPWLTFFCNYQVFFTVPAASHANMPLRFWSARPRLFPFPGKCATVFSPHRRKPLIPS